MSTTNFVLLATSAVLLAVYTDRNILKSGKTVSDPLAEDTSPSFTRHNGYPCNIDIVNGDELDEATFREVYFQKKPVLIVKNSHNRIFHETYTPEKVVEVLGDMEIQTNDGYKAARLEIWQNKKSVRRYYETAFKKSDALEQEHVHPDTIEYAFGIIDERYVNKIDYTPHPALGALLESSEPNRPAGAQFIAFGPKGAGIPFHQHFDAYAEQCSGLKKWHMFRENGAQIHFTNMASHATWLKLHGDHPTMNASSSSSPPSSSPKLGSEASSAMYTCVQGQGEIMYTPGGWKHATYSMEPGFAFVWQSWGGATQQKYEKMYTDLGFDLGKLPVRASSKAKSSRKANLDQFDEVALQFPQSSAIWAIYAQALRLNDDVDDFYSAADWSLQRNEDNVNLLFVYLHMSVEKGRLEKGQYALRRLREIQDEYDLGVHNQDSRRLYKEIDALEGLLKKGKPVPIDDLPNPKRFLFT